MSTFWKGMALPWGTTIPSVFDPKDDIDVLKTSILMIVCTGFGERVMFPTFGSAVGGLLFEQLDASTVNQIGASIQQAIALWDDRVTYVDYAVEKKENTIHITVSYKLNINANDSEIRTVDISVNESMLRAS